MNGTKPLDVPRIPYTRMRPNDLPKRLALCLYGPDAPGAAAQLAHHLNVLNANLKVWTVASPNKDLALVDKPFDNKSRAVEYMMRAQRATEDAALLPDRHITDCLITITDRPWRSLAGNLGQDATVSQDELISSVDAAAIHTRHTDVAYWVGDPSAEALDLTRENLESLGVKTILLDGGDLYSDALVVADSIADVSERHRTQKAAANRAARAADEKAVGIFLVGLGVAFTLVFLSWLLSCYLDNTYLATGTFLMGAFLVPLLFATWSLAVCS